MTRRFIYNLLTALPVTLAVAFGLSLWQSGGAVLDHSPLASLSRLGGVDYLPFNLSGAFTVYPAYAQTCDPTGNPAAPVSNSGGLYYNSCAKTFRVYADPAKGWQDFGAGYWAVTSSNYLYNVTPSQVVLSTVGAPAVTGSYPTVGIAGRDALVLNVNTAAGNIGSLGGTIGGEAGAVILTNAPGFGLYSIAGTGGWADLIISALTASKICLPDASNPANCIASWSTITGGGSLYWALPSAGAPIINTNAGGYVEVADTLYVDRAVYVRTPASAAATTWTLDSPFPSSSPCPAGGATCQITKMYTQPSTGYRVAVGAGGLAMFYISAVNGWQTISSYSAGSASAPWASIWMKNVTAGTPTVYAINPTTVSTGNNPHPGVTGLVYFSGVAGWLQVPVAASVGSYGLTDQNSHLWGFDSSHPYAGFVYFTGKGGGFSNRLSYYDIVAQDFAGVGNVTVPDNASLLAGNKFNDIYLASTTASGSTSPQFRKLTLTTATTATQQLTVTFATDLLAAFDPNAIAVDYNTQCSTCVVFVGKRLTAVNPVVATNLLIGDGSNIASNWNSAHPRVAVSGVTWDYNAPGVEITDAWVGAGGSWIIISGVDSRVGAPYRNFVLVTTDGGQDLTGADWTLTSPDATAPPCSTSPCKPYAVTGKDAPLVADTKVYAGNEASRIFYQGAGSPGGLLDVGGDIKAPGNLWGGSIYTSGFGTVPTSGSGAVNTQSTGSTTCPSGEYMVGVKLSAATVIGIYCQRL